ncbi:restriction endonuclease subunit S [Fusobacterium nucleatum]|uniref:restriction endonuclease subunit S n=1 Tax=Fusobacterium nucleatum TaxID=851 RepID=UPI00123D7D7A|nr:restriction endonuclease subunit S [Fusobacterium nucleatum]
MKIFNKNEWKKVKLGDVCEVITGNTPLKKIEEYWNKDEVPFITPPELKYEGINYITPNIYVSKIGAKQGRIIPKNSICVCCIGSLGKLGILKEDAITNQQINSLILKDKNVDLLYLYFYLKTIKNNLESIASSTTVKIINKSSFEKIEISLPNLEIQKKISKKLELLENNIKLRKSQLVFLKELTKSLFTRMFGTPEYNEKGWNFISLKDISYTKGEYGSNKPAINYNGGYRYIRITDINATGELKTEKVGVSDEEIEAQKYALKENDILFARSGATVGKNFLYNKKYGKCIFAGYLIRFKLNPHLISTKYLKIYLDTNYYWNWVKNCQNIVAQPNINAKQYGEDLKIMLPPIELQNKFAERIEKIEKLKFEIEKSIEMAQNLYNSLISKYFDN